MKFRCLLFLLLPLLLPPPAAEGRMVSSEQRKDAIRRARVWRAVDTAALDTLNGPPGEGSYKLGQEVPCRYEERDPLKPIGGHSPKFPCHDAAGARLKVKYGAGNPEVYGEVAATRLFWALGFPAERMYSVKIVCENCPVDPFVSSAAPRATRPFEPATIQKRLQGEELSETKDEGWTFEELDLVDEAAGGAPKAQVDALKLLAAMINHGDNTPNQQRLLCSLEEDPDCKRPLMYVTDLGSTFGGRDFMTSYRHWSKKTSVWKDAARCTADLTGSTDFRDPKIGEAGRKFLADLLGKLSERQVRDIFRGARFDVLSKSERPVPGPDGKARPVVIDDWVRLFLKKREQIQSARCPS